MYRYQELLKELPLLVKEHTVFGIFNGTHLVSINRDIINLGGERAMLLMKPQVTNWGYHRVCIYDPSTQQSKHLRVHRLVMLVHKPKGELKQVNHKDGNKTNNRIENLEWSTSGNNVAHAHSSGLHSAGRGTPKRTLRGLTDAQVIEAKKLKSQGLGNTRIGRKLGVSATTIFRVLQGSYV